MTTSSTTCPDCAERDRDVNLLVRAIALSMGIAGVSDREQVRRDRWRATLAALVMPWRAARRIRTLEQCVKVEGEFITRRIYGPRGLILADARFQALLRDGYEVSFIHDPAGFVASVSGPGGYEHDAIADTPTEAFEAAMPDE